MHTYLLSWDSTNFSRWKPSIRIQFCKLFQLQMHSTNKTMMKNSTMKVVRLSDYIQMSKKRSKTTSDRPSRVYKLGQKYFILLPDGRYKEVQHKTATQWLNSGKLKVYDIIAKQVLKNINREGVEIPDRLKRRFDFKEYRSQGKYQQERENQIQNQQQNLEDVYQQQIDRLVEGQRQAERYRLLKDVPLAQQRDINKLAPLDQRPDLEQQAALQAERQKFQPLFEVQRQQFDFLRNQQRQQQEEMNQFINQQKQTIQQLLQQQNELEIEKREKELDQKRDLEIRLQKERQQFEMELENKRQMQREQLLNMEAQQKKVLAQIELEKGKQSQEFEKQKMLFQKQLLETEQAQQQNKFQMEQILLEKIREERLIKEQRQQEKVERQAQAHKIKQTQKTDALQKINETLEKDAILKIKQIEEMKNQQMFVVEQQKKELDRFLEEQRQQYIQKNKKRLERDEQKRNELKQLDIQRQQFVEQQTQLQKNIIEQTQKAMIEEFKKYQEQLRQDAAKQLEAITLFNTQLQERDAVLQKQLEQQQKLGELDYQISLSKVERQKKKEQEREKIMEPLQQANEQQPELLPISGEEIAQLLAASNVLVQMGEKNEDILQIFEKLKKGQRLDKQDMIKLSGYQAKLIAYKTTQALERQKLLEETMNKEQDEQKKLQLQKEITQEQKNIDIINKLLQANKASNKEEIEKYKKLFMQEVVSEDKKKKLEQKIEKIREANKPRMLLKFQGALAPKLQQRFDYLEQQLKANGHLTIEQQSEYDSLQQIKLQQEKKIQMQQKNIELIETKAEKRERKKIRDSQIQQLTDQFIQKQLQKAQYQYSGLDKAERLPKYRYPFSTNIDIINSQEMMDFLETINLGDKAQLQRFNKIQDEINKLEESIKNTDNQKTQNTLNKNLSRIKFLQKKVDLQKKLRDDLLQKEVVVELKSGFEYLQVLFHMWKSFFILLSDPQIDFRQVSLGRLPVLSQLLKKTTDLEFEDLSKINKQSIILIGESSAKNLMQFYKENIEKFNKSVKKSENFMDQKQQQTKQKIKTAYKEDKKQLVKKSEEKIVLIEEQITDLRKKNSQHEKSIDDIKRQIQDLTPQMEALRQTRDQQKTKIKSETSLYVSQQKQPQQKQQAKDQAQKNLEALEEQYHQRLNPLKQQQQQLEEKIKNIQIQIKDNKVQIEKNKDKIKSQQVELSQQLNDLKEKYEQFKQEQSVQNVRMESKITEVAAKQSKRKIIGQEQENELDVFLDFYKIYEQTEEGSETLQQAYYKLGLYELILFFKTFITFSEFYISTKNAFINTKKVLKIFFQKRLPIVSQIRSKLKDVKTVVYQNTVSKQMREMIQRQIKNYIVEDPIIKQYLPIIESKQQALKKFLSNYHSDTYKYDNKEYPASINGIQQLLEDQPKEVQANEELVQKSLDLYDKYMEGNVEDVMKETATEEEVKQNIFNITKQNLKKREEVAREIKQESEEFDKYIRDYNEQFEREKIQIDGSSTFKQIQQLMQEQDKLFQDNIDRDYQQKKKAYLNIKNINRQIQNLDQNAEGNFRLNKLQREELNKHQEQIKQKLQLLKKKVGQGPDLNGEGTDRGLSDFDIDEALKNNKYYEGTFTLDDFNKIIDMIDINKKRQIFIINPFTDQFLENNVGHWVTLAVDNKNQEIVYFDSLANPIPRSIQTLVNFITQKLAPADFYKFKYNTQRKQKQDADSCGYFAIYFANDYGKTGSFKDASLYDKNIQESEKTVHFPFI